MSSAAAAAQEVARIKLHLDPDSNPTDGWQLHSFHKQTDAIVRQFFQTNKATTALPSISSSLFTADMREQKLYLESVPMLLEGKPMNNWPAMKKWKLDNIEEHYGSVQFNCGEDQLITLSTLLAYNRWQQDDTPLYIFDDAFHKRCPEMLNDYNQHIQDLFPDDLMHLMDTDRPPHRWLLIGAKGTGTDVHQDPAGTVAWNLCIDGTKLWALLHPSLTSAEVMANVVPPDQPSLVWFRDHVHTIVEQHPGKVKLVVQEPGQCLLVPANWWHAVFNLTDVVGVTENHVSLGSFCKEMDSIATAPARSQSSTERNSFDTNIIPLIEHHFGLIDAVAAETWYQKVLAYGKGKSYNHPLFSSGTDM